MKGVNVRTNRNPKFTIIKNNNRIVFILFLEIHVGFNSDISYTDI